MYYLRTGDINNSREINNLQQHNETADLFMTMIYNHQLNVDDIIENIYQLETFDMKVYNRICYLLTLGDELPPEKSLDIMMATAHFFCLQVNVLSIQNRSDKRIPSAYLAVKTAQAFNWNYDEYVNSEESLADNLKKDMLYVSVHFTYLLNEITFQIPITEVKKGFLRKKAVGFMIDTSLSAYGIMNIGNNQENYKVPKSFILDLVQNQINANAQYIFNEKSDLILAIDRTNSQQIMLDLLYINGFFGICSYTPDGDSEIWVDGDDDLLYVNSRVVPNYDQDEETISATWQKIREHLYRALTTHSKLYVSYKHGNKIYLMAN